MTNFKINFAQSYTVKIRVTNGRFLCSSHSVSVPLRMRGIHSLSLRRLESFCADIVPFAKKITVNCTFNMLHRKNLFYCSAICPPFSRRCYIMYTVSGLSKTKMTFSTIKFLIQLASEWWFHGNGGRLAVILHSPFLLRGSPVNEILPFRCPAQFILRNFIKHSGLRNFLHTSRIKRVFFPLGRQEIVSFFIAVSSNVTLEKHVLKIARARIP